MRVLNASVSLSSLPAGESSLAGRYNRFVPGRFLLRMPVSLHEQAGLAAASDGVSLNQFICGLVAAAVEWDGRSHDRPPRERRYPKTKQQRDEELYRELWNDLVN